jgi:predicted NodU family carbamoyl transferase
MNGKILLRNSFRRIYVQPAAGDSGIVGVCYQIYNDVTQTLVCGRVGNKTSLLETGAGRAQAGNAVTGRPVMEVRIPDGVQR